MSERDRAYLGPDERRAVAKAIRFIVDETKTQVAASVALNISQPAVGKAVTTGRVGPDIRDRVLKYFKCTSAELIERFVDPADRHSEFALPVDATDPYPSRAKAIALARIAGARDSACAWARAQSLRANEERSALWWLRLVVNRDAERADLADEITPPTPTVLNSELMQYARMRKAEQDVAKLEKELAELREKRKTPEE